MRSPRLRRVVRGGVTLEANRKQLTPSLRCCVCRAPRPVSACPNSAASIETPHNTQPWIANRPLQRVGLVIDFGAAPPIGEPNNNRTGSYETCPDDSG